MKLITILCSTIALLFLAGAGIAHPNAVEKKMVVIGKGQYLPFLVTKSERPIIVEAFLMDETAVTNQEYLEFVKANPTWAKSKANKLFADHNYLQHWAGDYQLGDSKKAGPNAPVTNVSWFAAEAYAKWKGKRLPTVAEWELAGHGRPQNLKKASLTDYILEWYNRPNTDILPDVKSTFCNEYGLYDMHGLVWEWTFNFNSYISTGDSRANTNEEQNLFCAAGSLTVKNKKDYAAFLRFSYRGSLKGNYCIGNLGFRCAKNIK